MERWVMSSGRAGENDALARNYEKPHGWWGLERDDAVPRTLPWLIRAGTLGAREAAFLSLAVEMRRTLIVAAEETRAGKTTLLTALLSFIDPTTRPVYVRGLYERFEYIEALDPANRYVLCNEISAHLPTYLWGHGVRRLFDGVAAGFPMATTMHAASAEEALRTLQRYPLDVSPAQVVMIDLIVTLKRGMVDSHTARRVIAIDRVIERNGAPALQRIAERNPLRAAPQIESGRMVAALARWGEISEDDAARLLAAQERFLRACAERDTVDASAFRDQIAMFRAGA
jgi:Flp pilus assembly CpaF family ATPase